MMAQPLPYAALDIEREQLRGPNWPGPRGPKRVPRDRVPRDRGVARTVGTELVVSVLTGTSE